MNEYTKKQKQNSLTTTNNHSDNIEILHRFSEDNKIETR